MALKIKKVSLDYRSDENTLNTQITNINSFLQGKDVIDFDIDNEFIYGIYLESAPVNQRTILAKKITHDLTFDEDWLNNKTIIKFVAKEDFIIALIE